MAMIKSLTESLGVLKDNPILFGAGVLYALIVLPQTALSAFGIPLLPRLAQMVTFFITPFVVAGLLAMAYEGLHRPTSFETFKKIGKDRYLSVLAGNLVKFVLDITFGIAFVIVFVFTIGFSIMAVSSQGDPSNALLGGAGLVAVAVIGLVVLVYLLVMFFLQFYAVAIVVDDADVLEGFTKSFAVVRQNPVPALGFSLLNLVIGVLIFVPAIAFVVAPILLGGSMGTGTGPGTTQAAGFGSSLLINAGILVYSLLVSIVMVPFRSAFSTAFYHNHT